MEQKKILHIPHHILKKIKGKLFLVSSKLMINSALAVWIQTNCNALNQREKYVEELMQYIKIDSYGSCLKNKEFPFDDNRHKEGWAKRKLEVISEYLVTKLILENIS